MSTARGSSRGSSRGTSRTGRGASGASGGGIGGGLVWEDDPTPVKKKRNKRENDASLMDEILALSGNTDAREEYRQKHEQVRSAVPYNGGGVKKRTAGDVVWRMIGITGELAITVILLIALFIGWITLYTNYVGHNNQVAVSSNLEEQWGKPSTSIGEKHTDPAPEYPVNIDEGMAFANLWVPAFGDHYKVPIAEGISMKTTLNSGSAGHYVRTGSIGQPGNFALAGLRNTNGSPFQHIDDLENGDELVIETKDAWYVYTFQGDTQILNNSDPRLKSATYPVPGSSSVSEPPTESILTLISQHPEWSGKERYILHAKFEYWTPKSEGYPEALASYTRR